jgi:hypothetical protein
MRTPREDRRGWVLTLLAVMGATIFVSCRTLITPGIKTDPAASKASRDDLDAGIEENAGRMLKDGRKIFRYDTFGSEAFWGGQLQLHKAILGEKGGGVGPGLTPNQALKTGLKVDIGKLPRALVAVIQETAISLENPETTVALLKADAVVGVQGVFDKEGRLSSVGITCALCHSTVDNSFASGIGHRLDGWPNRDLDVGAVAAMSPSLKPFSDLAGVSEDEVRKVLKSWGPGRYDAEFTNDGKAFRPDGKSAATVLPAAFGLAGVNLHTYTGWGSVPYWNAYVANTQMFGHGRFYDPRLKDGSKYPLAVKGKSWDIRGKDDSVTAKLPALHFYQLSIPAPEPPEGSFNKERAAQGEALFNGKAGCATCHTPPLYTEPGWAMHKAEEIGIDDFQAKRSPNGMYRTTPLKGLFTRAKGGFYHDGRFKDLDAVVQHYDGVKKLGLTEGEKKDLAEFLKSL